MRTSWTALYAGLTVLAACGGSTTGQTIIQTCAEDTDCTGHGSCDLSGDEAQCVCDTGWTGATCDVCADGYHAAEDGGCVVDEVCTNKSCLSGVCVDATGVVECHCYPGWAGATCNSCAAGFHDDGNGICVGDEMCTDSSCAHDGTCNDDEGMVTCLCKAGYTGPACEDCDEGYHFDGDGECVLDETCGGEACGPHGTCEERGGEVDCICDTGWTGNACDLCYPGYHDEEGECVLDTACGPQTCGGHGLCSATGGEVTCDCDEGYTGLACTSCDAGYHRDDDDECVPDETCEGETSCEPNGYCQVDGGVAGCVCFLGWDGPECGICAAGYHDSEGDCLLDQQCLPSTCGGHGACDDEGGIVTCVCEEGYVGNWCEACDDGFHLESMPGDDGGGSGGFVTGSLGVCVADEVCAEDTCGEHGTCDDETGVIVCACDDGYAGLNCELCAAGFHLEEGLCVLDAQCLPTTCSGHGVCTAEDGQTSCECDEGYVGPACASCAEGLHFNVDGECVEGTGNPLALIVIRDAENGGGEVANDYALVVGDEVTFYAAGYDTELNYVGDVSVVWTTGGSLPTVQAGPQTSFTYTATAAGTSGKVFASFADPEVTGDETGIISVTAAPPGDPDVGESSITALPTSIIANGTSTSTVTVILRDEHGTVLTSSHDVVIETTAGTLVGSPVQHGDGSYTQTLRSSVAVETATLVATVNGEPIEDTATVAFVSATDLVNLGVTTIDCDNYPSYKGQNLLIQNGTVEINSRGCSPMEFGSVTLHNNNDNPCVVTHAAATDDDWQKVDIQVTSLHIEPGCKIDVTAKGYLGAVSGAQARGQGNVPLAGPLANVGGTHGGLGGGVTDSRLAYGGVRNPAEPGAGGGEYNTNAGEYGGAGGGLVRVHVLTGGYMVNDGGIYADGQTRTPNRASGGAGGGVLLNTPRLLGAGVITAKGGGAHTSYGYGGGGGRIAVTGLLSTGGVSGTFAAGNALESMLAHGGPGRSGSGGAGTVWVRYAGDIDGRLFVANDGQASADGSTPLFCVPEGTVDDYDSAGFDDLDGNLRPDLYAGTQVNVDIHANATPGFADDPIFTVLGNDAFRVNLAQSPLGQTQVDAVYRGVEVVDRLIVTDDGHLDARGCDLWVKGGGLEDPTHLGIEGQLWVARADLGPVETIAVTGGGLMVEEYLVGSNDAAFPFALTLSGGVSAIPTPTLVTLHADGGARFTTNDLTVHEDAHVTGASAVTADDIDVEGDLRVDAGSTVTVEALSVIGTLLLTDAGTTLTQPETGAGPTERHLAVEVGTLSLQDGAVIDVTGKGWAGGSGAHTNGYAMISGLEAPPNCGGSHGGISTSDCGVPSYDSLYRPRHNGAGAGRASSYDHAGGAGGGSVMITAQTVAHLNGAVRANGVNGVGRAGGGAGGSIYITAPTVDGSGPLEAYGGAHTSSYAYGGGGGMIAVVASSTLLGVLGDTGIAGDNQPWMAVKIYGGQGRSGVYAGSGTFYRRVGDADGDLMVDNADHNSDPGSTPLAFQGLATFGSINATTMTGTAAFDLTGAKDDYLLNPAVGQGTPSLADDNVYRITDTAGPVLVFSGTPDPSTFATPGTSEWSAFYRFDNLEIRGNAQLAADAEVRVDMGDMASRDASSFRLRGALDVRTLDLNDTTAIELVAGTSAGLAFETIVQGDATDFTFDWILNDGMVTAPALHGASLSADGAVITVDAVEVSGDAVLAGGTLAGMDTLHVAGNATLSSGSKLEIGASTLNVDGALTITDAGTLVTHLPTGTGDTEQRLVIHTDTLTMTSGGAIDVTGRGYAGGSGAHTSGYAPIANLEAAVNCGGSHGGTTAPDCASLSYDSLYHPRHNGAGGGRASSYDHAGGAGGGSVEIFATSVAHLDGVIRANGENGVGRAAGGAGGSIYVEAPLIDGGGALEAYGGAHTSSYAYGGGGGMIALVATAGIHGVLGGGVGDANTPWDVVRVYGGQGRSGVYAGSGTFYRRVGAARGDLMVDNAERSTFGGSTPLVFQGSGPSTALTATQLTASTLFDTHGAVDGYLVNPKMGQGTVSLGDDVVYTIAGTAGSKLTLSGTPDPTTIATAGDPWTAFYRFENVEVRGRAQVYADAEMRVDDGDISSGDDTTFRLRGRLDVRTLDLNQVVTVELVDNAAGELATDTLIQGENTEFDFDWVLNDGVFQKPSISGASISASGARIEVDTMDISGDASFVDGSDVTAGSMDIGGDAVINGSSVTVDTVHIGGNATVSGGSTVTVEDDLLSVEGTLTIAESGTTVTHAPTGEGPERRLRVEARVLAMAQGGAIDVSGKGWAGGSGAHTSGYAPLTSLEPPVNCGGTHGGVSAPDCPQPSFDSIYHPIHNGVGGGRASSYDHAGGAGGGSVEIVAVSAAHLGGVIRANGANGVGRAAGGAGGSIYVEAPLIDGSGTLEAVGGAHTSSYAYGGGGGMIALNAGLGLQGVLGDAPGGQNQPWTVVSVYGGQGRSGTYAGSGTFYRRVGAADGDLLVDNADRSSFPGSTPLVFQGSGLMTQLSATSLDGGTLFDAAGPIDDYLVNPKSGQGTISLGDDHVYRIVDTDGSQLAIAGSPDPTTFAIPGDTWSAYYRFDNLEIRGGAQLAADAEVRVDAGDMASGDAATFRLRGGLDVRALDLAAVTAIELVDGAQAVLATDALVQGTATDYAFDWILNDGAVDLAGLYGVSVTADGGQLVADVVDVSGDATLAGATVTVDAMWVDGDAALTDASDAVIGALDVGGHVTVSSGADAVIGTLDVGGDASLSGAATLEIGETRLAIDGALTISDSGTVLTHTATGTGPERRLRVEAAVLTMALDGAIDVSGKGWAGGSGAHTAGYAALTAQEAAPACGGSHGGYSYSGTCLRPTFDSLYHPTKNGAGGGRATSYDHAGGAGGGAVELIIGSAAHLNGAIRANGGNGVGRAAGGAGGAIYVAAPFVDGTGRLEAAGGNGSSSYAYGGGGGMIAVVASGGIQGALGDTAAAGDNQPWTLVSVQGGLGTGNNYGGSGTFYRRVGGADGDLMLDNGGHSTAPGSTRLVFEGSGLMTQLTATSLSAPAAFDLEGELDDYLVNPKEGQGQPTLGDDHLYRIVASNGNTLTLTGSPDPTGVANPATDRWTAAYRFDNLEIRGGASLAGDVELRIDAGDMHSEDTATLALGGDVSVRTLDVGEAQTLSITALDVTTLVGGAAPGVVDPRLDWAIGAGTVDLGQIVARDLTVTGATFTADSVDATGLVTLTNTTGTVGTIAAGDLTLSGTTALTISGDTVDVDDSLWLTDSASLTHPAAGASYVPRLLLTAAQVTIDPSASIDVSYKGWPGASGAIPQAQSWPEGATTYGPGLLTGGCHGGIGFVGSGGSACIPYGRFDDAWWPGSGGGRYNTSTSYRGGAGGGVVRVIASDVIIIHGAIKADGEYATSGRGGGGAGGSVYLNAPNIGGNGTVSARGGDAHASYGAGGGGGGRIVVTGYDVAGGSFGLASPWTSLTAAGGSANGSRVGGAGTIFLLPRGYSVGTLVVDNDDRVAADGSTVLASIGVGTAANVTATTFTDATKTWYVPDYYAGTTFRADLTGGGTPTLADDVISTVVGNTAIRLTSSDLPAGFSTGSGYRGFVGLDQLEVRGGAQVTVDGDLIVYNGDVSSGAAALAVGDGASLTVTHQLEVDGVPQASITGTVSGNPLVCTDCP